MKRTTLALQSKLAMIAMNIENKARTIHLITHNSPTFSLAQT
jgi:hypothetical protein